ncbi:uncharacterized protein L3040_008652 [Drepanopeziza brunnea f. sp. 'multigermtubi']|uniref:DUF676 domain-containing protein n=1 Tax=Marssonina brunnea f. sp. multigermtubi (strain MB_m1) TaxID=1072389 RepID=K1WKU2_MARBU|nr:uncharacterized protein MBM_08199 [Drepanopeziza brunnea f. sp. 'multigermtubi' MB_m1]EKD13481.1 hypothetical protein MBM_08199 [Drepanopeziza brunnea f. sp. 'multigermtubi' MB_m1]KAJ5033539.1 hypothetical protein L3040_008652 [Drepanopeziza brunnea f. sp. 'multigermtubi']
MATQAQLDEKALRDRTGATAGPSLEERLATHRAQLAEKAQRDRDHGPANIASASEFATPAQLAEKSRQLDNFAEAFATSAQLAEKSRGRPGPPPLPPRTPSTPTHVPPPPAYSIDDAKRSELVSEQWRSRDPRSSSTHSLVPSESHRDGRRTLLLVYIHGFLGNETSFRSFPAHVHNLLTITLSKTHVVHTKIYPRYKSRKDIAFARDDFSTWLEPHENNHTEIVLLGHSMGGILGAEVALQKPASPATGRPFRHRLLGTVNFDTPFLGMHPGVVVSGISSLFRPAPEPPGAPPPQSFLPSGANTPSLDSQATPSYPLSTVTSDVSSSTVTLVQSITSPQGNATPNDPFFNPPFPNDVRLPERTGWSGVLHFVNKHSDGLTDATKQYFISHLEFGGCMADYPGLKNRYEKIRALEDVSDLAQSTGSRRQPQTQRVRFINYYTASTGRSKQPKSLSPGENGVVQPVEVELDNLSLATSGYLTPMPGTPRISVEEHGDGTVTPQPLVDGPAASLIEAQMKNLGVDSGIQNNVQEDGSARMQHIDSVQAEGDEDMYDALADPSPLAATEEMPIGPSFDIKPTTSEPALPPIPPIPIEPEVVDLEAYTDKDLRKAAEKEQKRVMRAYQQAVKDRDSSIKDRHRLSEKRERKARQEREKEEKAEVKKRLAEGKKAEKQRLAREKERLKEEERRMKEEEKCMATSNPELRKRGASVASSVKADKPKRDKKFCMLPPGYNGKRDKCWVRVYMEGVDEVGAHCGLFFAGPHYESLVGDVGDRIGKWVQEDAYRRAVQEV